MKSHHETKHSPSSSCRELIFENLEESGLGEIDFKTQLSQVFAEAFHLFVERTIENETIKIEVLARIPVIIAEHEILERIYALFIYMNDVQLQQCRSEIVQLLSANNGLFNALIQDSSELDEPYEILTLDMRKLLNSKGIQTVMPFQFHGKIQRRLDSLARILIPFSRYTVCVALTIVGDKLFISANHDGAITETCANHIWNRLYLFREFFRAIPPEYYDENFYREHQTSLSNKIDTFLPSLIAQGGNGVSTELLTQAIQKIVFACANPLADEELDKVERDNFTLRERAAILDNPEVKILIPKKIDGEALQSTKTLCYSEFTTSPEIVGNEEVPVIERLHVIGKFQSNLSIRYIHCEQLLLYYFDAMSSALSPRSHAEIKRLRLGISKLCCQTCIIAIDEWNRRQRGQMQVSVRGWHEKTYSLVLNLFHPQAFSFASPEKVKVSSREDETPRHLTLEREAIKTIYFHKPIVSEAESATVLKRTADAMAAVGEQEGLSTPKRPNKRTEVVDGGDATATFACAKALVSPNTPYDGLGRINYQQISLHPGQNLLAMPLSFIEKEEENLEKQPQFLPRDAK